MDWTLGELHGICELMYLLSSCLSFSADFHVTMQAEAHTVEMLKTLGMSALTCPSHMRK